VFAGPTSGGAATPAFRALVVADISDIATTYQPLDADLTAIAALSSTGIPARTAANTWALRTITGTTNRIGVTNGDGVSGNPTIDVHVNYAGQTSITTLGTITNGIWNAVPIAAANGGTGQIAYAVGDLLYASASSALSRLADVATGNALISGGVGAAPSWGKIDLTAHLTGILPSANGGTGVNNAGTITNANNTTITGGGTLALGGFTLTVPATGTAALRASSATAGRIAFWSDAQSLSHDSGLFWDTTAKKVTINNGSVGGDSLVALSGGSTVSTSISLGRTAVEGSIAISGDVADFFTESTPGALGVKAASKLLLGAGSSAALTVLTTTVGIGQTSPRAKLDVTGAILSTDFLRAEGYSTPPTGEGLELGYSGAVGYVSAFNRTTSAWKPLIMRGASIFLRANNVDFLSGADTGGTSLYTTDAGTAGASAVLTMYHRTSGAPTTGYGADVLLALDSATVADRAAMLTRTIWATATDASRKARTNFFIYDTTNRTAMTIEASGTAAMIGFLGASAVARQNITGVHSGTLAQLQTAFVNLLTGLANLGLITDSTT
jgi:hypothetical protein